MFKEVPEAESGEKYKTLDARCNACVIQGGDEHPCMPPHYLAAEEEQTGYPCPRREWPSPDGPAITQLVYLGAHAETGHLFRDMFDAYFGGEERRDRRRVLRMVLLAYRDEVVRAALWPKRE